MSFLKVTFCPLSVSYSIQSEFQTAAEMKNKTACFPSFVLLFHPLILVWVMPAVLPPKRQGITPPMAPHVRGGQTRGHIHEWLRDSCCVLHPTLQPLLVTIDSRRFYTNPECDPPKQATVAGTIPFSRKRLIRGDAPLMTAGCRVPAARLSRHNTVALVYGPRSYL